MSRRKQAKPQHINSDEPGSAENGLLQNGEIEEEGTESKRFRMDETRVCTKCCAECFDEADFLKHQKNCTKSQQVVIVKDGEARAEDFSRDSSPDDGAQSDHDNDHDLASGGGNPPSDADAEPTERAGDEERPNSNGDDDSASRQEQAVASASPEMNYQPSPKQQNSNVTLESMPATKVAVTQHSWSRSPPPTAQEVVQSIPLILEQLVSLQQQQLQQIQLTEQIRIQVAMMAPQSLHSAMGAAVDPLKALGAHLSQQLSAAAALIGKRTGSQSLTMEAMKLGKLAQPDPPPGLGSKSDLCKGLPDLAGRLPALLPQSPGALAFPGSFTGLPSSMDPSKKPKVKIPNAPPYETKNGSGGGSSGGDPAFKHKCKYCGKTFGNDSALQIHLRSHTGERPFKCNICGNRFTTKGNLKVHFQRHREKYPHVRMNPHPVPEHLDHVPTSSGIPYGMSMPIEESNMVDVKPAIGHLAAPPPPAFHPSPSLQGFKSSFESFGGDPFSHHRPSSSGSDGASISSHAFGGGHHEMNPDHHHNPEPRDPRHANGGDPSSSSATAGGEHHISSGTAKLQQMVDGLEKRTGDPNECVICHRVLSCQSSLKMHYRTHTGERPYKCKICGRAFSTKGNLKAHYGVHRANTPLKMQHSCPICQKKFTNAVVLQQHIRMHMGGQIPNTPHVPENQYDNPADDTMVSSPPDEKLMDGFDESMEDEDAELDSREKPCDAPSDPPLLLHQSGGEEQQQQQRRAPPPPPMFSGIAALENHMKNLTQALNLQRQSSTASESDGGGAGGATRGSPSSSSSAAPPREAEYQNGRSPAVSDSAASFHSASSPVNSYVGSSQSKSPESSAAAPEDSTGFRNGTRPEPDMMGSQEAGESGGALDLTAPSSFVPKQIKEEPRAIKEEPGLPYSNGEYGAPSHMPYMRMVPSLTSLEMQIPSENPLGPHGLFGSPLSQGLGMSSPLSNQGAGMMSSSSSSSGSSAPRRSMKQHLCNACGKNFSSASALQIHERTHTGEKPFACTICGRAFTTKGNLKVHVGTHMWSNSSRRGQRLSLDNPMALMAMGSESGMMPDMMPPPPKELGGPPPMNFDQSMWNQYAAALTNGLSMKTNEISVIQNGGIPLPGSLSAGPLVGSTGGLMKLDGSHSGLPTSMAEIENSGSESVPKSQFPHFMEEGKIAVN